ncbi:alpha-L-fucosidase [Chloroflexota bacterium]
MDKKQDNHITDTNYRMDWFKQAKFGLFLHWGAYTVAGVEASWPIMAPELSETMFKNPVRITQEEYIQLPSRFNPTEFDPNGWVKLAKKAGMRYIIITAKHHDGFCMFDAPGTDYKITNSPFGRDICLELSEACAKQGMPLGFYYSPPDMHHPGYRDTGKQATRNWLGEPRRKEWDQYLDYMESHIEKLLTGYGRISVLWFDGLFNHGKYDPPRFHKLVHKLSPGTLVNDRLGDGYDYITPEQFIPKKGIPALTGKPPGGMDPAGDGFVKTLLFLMKIPGIKGWLKKQMGKYADGSLELTPVLQEPYPSPVRFQPWETCMTMGGSWAHNPQETDWKSPGQLVRNLVEVVSRGGNYLLNVGPTAQGTFPDEAVDRLKYIGEWMKTNDQAVYGTSYTPISGASWGQTTGKGDKVYLHIFNWPSDGKLTLSQFPGQVKEVNLLAGGKLEYAFEKSDLLINLPEEGLDPDVSVIEVTLKGSDPAWEAFSPPTVTRTLPRSYLKIQAIASGLINAFLNGLIAFFSYRSREMIPFAEASIDILITVAIISFLVAWIGVGSARGEIIKGNLSTSSFRFPKLPQGSAFRTFFIMIACVMLFGGLFMGGLLYFLSPQGLNNWTYIIIKTLYTGVTGALGTWLAVTSVLADRDRKAK